MCVCVCARAPAVSSATAGTATLPPTTSGKCQIKTYFAAYVFPVFVLPMYTHWLLQRSLTLLCMRVAWCVRGVCVCMCVLCLCVCVCECLCIYCCVCTLIYSVPIICLATHHISLCFVFVFTTSSPRCSKTPFCALLRVLYTCAALYATHGTCPLPLLRPCLSSSDIEWCSTTLPCNPYHVHVKCHLIS
jgi:hypothetical protein